MAFNVKNTTLPNIIDLISPHKCRGCGRVGEAFCERCKKYIIDEHRNICPNCKEEKTSDICSNCKDLPSIYVGGKRDGVLGELIHDYKYYSVRALARPLAEILDAALPVELARNTVIVPLPTATNHIRERGMDHVYLVAKRLAKIRKIPIERVLIRNKNTVQVGSSREQRLLQADLAYELNPKFGIDKNKTYIIIDDVWTTGASVKAAVKKLRAGGAKSVMAALIAYSS